MSDSEHMLRILLAEDQSLFAESLKTFLMNYAEDMQVLGIAGNGKEAVAMTAGLHPDIILMDVFMPVMNGVEATTAIKASHPEVKIIMLSTYDEDEYVRKALLAGASGYLLKDISPTELILSIRALQTGIMQISPAIARNLVHKRYVEEQAPVQEQADDLSRFEWFKTLSKREREIFALLATGCDNAGIARTLNLAEQTVRNQVSLVYAKLEVQNRFEIIRLANKLKP